PARDGYVWIDELTVGSVMADAQFGDLAGAAGRGILVAFAARLRVVEWAEAVGDGFAFLKLGLIGGVRGVVGHSVGFIGKTGGGLWKRRSEQKDREHEAGKTHQGAVGRRRGGTPRTSTSRPNVF